MTQKGVIIINKILSQKLIREVIGDVHLKIHCSQLSSFHRRTQESNKIRGWGGMSQNKESEGVSQTIGNNGKSISAVELN